MNFKTEFELPDGNFRDVFSDHKVVHVKSNENDMDLTGNLFKKLASEVGIPLVYEEDPISGQIDLTRWTEIKYKPETSHDSYKHSNHFQPLHTDYCYFSFEIYASFFYCVEQAGFGGATTFINVDQVVEILGSENNSLLDRLQNQQISFGRKNNPIAQNTDYILKKDEKGWQINWNYYRAQNDVENKPLIDEFRDFLDTSIEKSGELLEIKLQPGEGVFFHDRKVLHGRNSFLGNRQLNKGGIAVNLPEYVQEILKISGGVY